MFPPPDRQAVQRRDQLLAELERIRRILADDPRVLHLTVFGSLAVGQVHDWSDLDLAVVVVEGERQFADRALDLRKRLRARVGLDVLVYTPQEWRELSVHRPFVREEMVRRGRVVPLRPQQEAERWLAFAEDDLRVARLALEEGLYAQVCFHAQQCVEKSLKALLTRAGQLVPRTHRIDDLWAELPAWGRTPLDPMREALLELDGYYAITRYPDAAPGTGREGLPGPDHADRALRAAQRCWQVASDLVRSGQDPTAS